MKGLVYPALAMNEIVSIQHCEAVTDSRKVGKAFGKEHKNILASIGKMECSEPFRRLNFKPSAYINEQGKSQPMFYITRDGFSFLAMGFTGKRAAQFREQFINAFNLLERSLVNQQNLSWQYQRGNGKVARHSETDTIARFIQYATEQGSQHAKLYFLNLTRMTHHALNLARESVTPALRDTLDAKQLNFLATAEYLIEIALDEGMTAGKHYKDVYQMARSKVLAFAGSLPYQRQISE